MMECQKLPDTIRNFNVLIAYNLESNNRVEISCNGRCQTTSSTSSYQDKPFHEPIKSPLQRTQIKITFPLLLLLLWFFIYSITINYVVGKTVECHFFLFPTCLKKWCSLIFIRFVCWSSSRVRANEKTR